MILVSLNCGAQDAASCVSLSLCVCIDTYIHTHITTHTPKANGGGLTCCREEIVLIHKRTD